MQTLLTLLFLLMERFTNLAIQYNTGVQVKEHYEVKTVDIDWFEEL